jgi:hypothetical protein
MKELEEALRYLYDAWNRANAVSFYRVTAAARCLEMLSAQHKLDDGINLGTSSSLQSIQDFSTVTINSL